MSSQQEPWCACSPPPCATSLAAVPPTSPPSSGASTTQALLFSSSAASSHLSTTGEPVTVLCPSFCHNLPSAHSAWQSMPTADGPLWHTLAGHRALPLPAASAGGATVKAHRLSGCHKQKFVLNSALPSCRFMCTPHWQLFYLGVSTLLGGQGCGPHKTQACAAPPRNGHPMSSTCWAFAYLGSCALLAGHCSSTHHICTAAPWLMCAAAPHLKNLL